MNCYFFYFLCWTVLKVKTLCECLNEFLAAAVANTDTVLLVYMHHSFLFKLHFLAACPPPCGLFVVQQTVY